MSRPIFALIWIAVIALIFVGMWWGWRARARRDAGVTGAEAAPSGALIVEFPRAYYVSTTPVGEPMTRVAAPGLRYRGFADVTVREDGVSVEIPGERPVHVAAGQLRGSGSAGRRVGKAVERDGLGLMRWSAEGRELESSFRFGDRAEQQRFADAIDSISPAQAETQADTGTDPQNDPQEGAR